jgi:23S rRNA (cytidine1920-2'-O)/16S rRNA (cytidine1409-2'-O)-methyltransferase
MMVNRMEARHQMRLDQMLVDRGLAVSRSRARDLILRRFVRVDGVVCDKPARDVTAKAAILVAADAPQFVSRAAEKLLHALDHFAFETSGLVALDIGASTGGFTEVLLQRGAARVYAVDVGTGQLHASLRADKRVVVLEQLDSRGLTTEHIPEAVGAIVADVSFISLSKALAVPLTLAAPGSWLVALIKPQFEAGPDAVGKGGIVRDAGARAAAVRDVEQWLAAQQGWRVLGVIESPILGGSGNTEFLIGVRRDG